MFCRYFDTDEMVHIAEDKLKAAIQIALSESEAYTDDLEGKLVHHVKALSIDTDVLKRKQLLSFLEMLESTPKVEIPLQVSLIAVDEFLAKNYGKI